MSITAFSAIVTMHQAAWGDEAGSTVTFKLPMRETGDSRNPFHDFTKRRKGKAGTRFYMSVNTVSDAPTPIYKDEVMLAGWNDSQQNGHTVKFWLCNDAMGHPFEGYSRTQELAIALSELDDDNEPIDQKMRDKVEQQINTGKQKTSNVAAMFCRTKEFWAFINEDIVQSDDFISPKVANEEGAKQWIYQKCGIKSRAELDTESQATQHFRNITEAYQEFYADHSAEPPF